MIGREPVEVSLALLGTIGDQYRSFRQELGRQAGLRAAADHRAITDMQDVVHCNLQTTGALQKVSVEEVDTAFINHCNLVRRGITWGTQTTSSRD